MSLPSSWVSFNGREIARLGVDGVYLIDISAPQVTRQTATHQCCEAEESVVEDVGNMQTVLSVDVSREFADYPSKRAWLLRHLTEISKGTGALQIIEGGDAFEMTPSVCAVETVDNYGIGIGLRYTFTGGRLKQLIRK